MSNRDYAWHAAPRQLAQAALKRGGHALLIAGARGLGKSELALELAAGYLCASPAEHGYACGICESCHWLAAGTHPDFALVEPPAPDAELSPGQGAGAATRGKPIGVDQIRALNDLLAVSAHRDAGKAVVIRPAEMLHRAAANALLKSLEEPPSGVVFLLVADRPALLLPTIRSRCQLIPVPLADGSSAAAWLAQQGIAEPALGLALSGGAPLEAAAIAQDAAWQRRRSFLQALSAERADPVRVVETFRELQPALILSWLQKWTFDLVSMRLCGRARYHVDMLDELRRASPRLDPIRVTRLHRALLAMQRHVNHPLNARLFLEHMVITYSQALRQHAEPA
ncbi:MAG: DNA polymerase III subunit delta' [Burkholderiales bacterium]|nr:DNA polymerase III subunit delta' [Burkholderiales bacterium]